MEEIVKKYKEWKIEYPDSGYQYDEIFEFIAGLSRGEMQCVFEFLEEQQGLLSEAQNN